jgi:hypothetical protein
MLITNRISKLKFFGVFSALAALCLSLVVLGPAKTHAAIPTIKPETGPASKKGLKPANFGQTPLLFEQNQGQAGKTAKFIARGSGYTLYLAPTEAVFSLNLPNAAGGEAEARHNPREDVMRMQFAGANGKPTINGEHESVTRSNYYRGKKRFENIPNFRQVNYRNVYPGVDAVFYGTEGKQLEYDFVVAPNADPNRIRLSFTGAEKLSVNAEGDLVIKTAHTELVQHCPVAYQMAGGERREVASNYVISDETTVTFSLGDYDHGQKLVIDPRVAYLTYLGGNGGDNVTDIKVDQAGDVFAAGSTTSTNFPGPNPGSGNTGFAAFVSKLSPDGSTVLYTTFLDGEDNDGQNSLNVGVFRPDLALDAVGNAYLAGGTDSADFPVTNGAYQTRRLCGGVFGCLFPEEGFVTKLNSQGNIVYSTFLGGRNSDYLNSIAVDSSGRAYVTGGTYSGLTFPTNNQFQGTGVFGSDTLEAFLTVFNADGSDILYSTGLGGSGVDQGNEIALDAANNVYLVGRTTSDANSFPLRNAFQNTNGGSFDVFVAKFNTSLSGDASLIYSTFLGGSGTDNGVGIAVDSAGQAYITGSTGSSNFPLDVPFRSTFQGSGEAFVSIISVNGNDLVTSSFLGGSNQEEGKDIALGPNGLIYVTGNTQSTDFPMALPFQPTNRGGADAFVTKLKFGVGVISSSYLGGTGNDIGLSVVVRGNQIFISGVTGSNNLITTPGVVQPNPGADNTNSSDGFIARILDTAVDSVGVFRPASSSFLLTQSTTNVVSQTANSTSQLAGQKGVSGDWDGDGTDTIGSFTNGTWKIRNANFPLIVLPPPNGAITVTFGTTGDLPVAGDWNGDGIDTPGVFRPSTGQFTVTDSTSLNPGFNNAVTRITFGAAGDLPISGDWDGDGKDSFAVYRPSTGQTFFTNVNLAVRTYGVGTPNAGVDITAFLGVAEDLPVGGDWDGDGIDSLGLWRPSTAQFFLTDDNANLRPTFIFGQTGDQPIVGDWDGKPNP